MQTCSEWASKREQACKSKPIREESFVNLTKCPRILLCFCLRIRERTSKQSKPTHVDNFVLTQRNCHEIVIVMLCLFACGTPARTSKQTQHIEDNFVRLMNLFSCMRANKQALASSYARPISIGQQHLPSLFFYVCLLHPRANKQAKPDPYTSTISLT